MRQYKKINIIWIVLLIFATTTTISTFSRLLLKEKTKPNKYGIQKGEIIQEIKNGNTIDVIVKENENMIFYSYEILDNGKNKEIIEVGIDNYLSYEARKKVERENIEKTDIESHLKLWISGYKDFYKDVKRKPYCGVSVSADIWNLKINNNSVEKVIEYNEGDKKLYIWYFADLNVKMDDKPIIQFN